MYFIKRLSVSCLRKSKIQQRCQSNRRPTAPLGSRILTDPTKAFEHNMWDHMQWSQEEEERAREKATENALVRVQPEAQDKYEREASKYWNEFYKTHKDNFFKDRNWLFLEFPEILPEGKKTPMNEEEKSLYHVKLNATNKCTNLGFPGTFEEGKDYCQKNSVDGFTSVQEHAYNKSQAEPVTDNQCIKNYEKELLKQESFPGSDASYRILESHLSCNSAWCFAFVHDVCDDALRYPFPDEILDVILLVFVLSAIHPDRMQGVVSRLAKLLKPGGMMLFRDYGRYDTSQLRFKKGRCLSENFYVRGDGTRVYFFTKDEVHNMFTLAGLVEVQNLVDRRLQVNRKKKVKMQRVWIQSKFQKPFQPPQNSCQ
uniref:tRNA N(3)-cytidine methyltransferase n=1 Tax=Pelusios castaneus TaxID=367368 RepID=A0A8C8SKD5_9SAUR